MRFLFIVILLICSIFLSCKKPKKYSVIPYLEFESFNIIDSTDALGKKKFGILKFTFIDGDGDIGLTESDTLPPFDLSSIYYHDLFIEMFKKVNGNYDSVKLIAPYYYRLPFYVNTANDKALKGKIIVDMIMPVPIPSDTIKLQFYIFDRALNKSNIVNTSDFILN